MALKPISAAQLADTPTLFASFMGRTGESYKTVGELRAIYRERAGAIGAGEDHADSLRVERFMNDMATDGWTNELVTRVGVFDGTTLMIDGIHRGIAYLGCIERGVSPERLPALCVDR